MEEKFRRYLEEEIRVHEEKLKYLRGLLVECGVKTKEEVESTNGQENASANSAVEDEPVLRKGNWTSEEDAALLDAISIYGLSNMHELAKHVKTRTVKQIRRKLEGSFRDVLQSKDKDEEIVDMKDHESKKRVAEEDISDEGLKAKKRKLEDGIGEKKKSKKEKNK